MKNIADPERIISYLNDWNDEGEKLNDADVKVIDIVAHSVMIGMEKDEIFKKHVKETCESVNKMIYCGLCYSCLANCPGKACVKSPKPERCEFDDTCLVNGCAGDRFEGEIPDFVKPKV